ncbi:MAG: NYN domain-containing protein, partial [Rhizomicrobium sp.]
PMVADELRRQADNFIELDDLKSQIAREGSRTAPQFAPAE